VAGRAFRDTCGKLIFCTKALYLGSSLSVSRSGNRQEPKVVHFVAGKARFEKLQRFLLLAHHDAGFDQNGSHKLSSRVVIVPGATAISSSTP